MDICGIVSGKNVRKTREAIALDDMDDVDGIVRVEPLLLQILWFNLYGTLGLFGNFNFGGGKAVVTLIPAEAEVEQWYHDNRSTCEQVVNSGKILEMFIRY
ncbi:Uncharacterized protein Fot_28842 [Forsythia ovata]|uniref:Uncharacterized protein n=1 Tax=Forsythia ovata TaxID=205694 RepID=A0ABD1TQ57_9LAMI